MSTDDRIRAAERSGDKERLAIEMCRRSGHESVGAWTEETLVGPVGGPTVYLRIFWGCPRCRQKLREQPR